MQKTSQYAVLHSYCEVSQLQLSFAAKYAIKRGIVALQQMLQGLQKQLINHKALYTFLSNN